LLAEGVGNAPTSAMPILFSRQVQPSPNAFGASLNLPTFLKSFFILHFSFELAARVGLAPTPNGLTGRHATLTPPGSGSLALPAGFSPA
jgi:hypothetical protein